MSGFENRKSVVSFENKGLLIVVLVIAALLLAYGGFTMVEPRTLPEKLSDAYDELPKGVDKAARQLEDRTPVQKLGDTVRDAGDTVKENTSR